MIEQDDSKRAGCTQWSHMEQQGAYKTNKVRRQTVETLTPDQRVIINRLLEIMTTADLACWLQAIDEAGRRGDFINASVSIKRGRFLACSAAAERRPQTRKHSPFES